MHPESPQRPPDAPIPVDNSEPPVGALVRDGIKGVGWVFHTLGKGFDRLSKEVEDFWSGSARK